MVIFRKNGALDHVHVKHLRHIAFKSISFSFDCVLRLPLHVAGVAPPLQTIKGGANLDDVFRLGVDALTAEVPDPFERGAAFFLFGALQQFFFDGNKRTSRFMMNGILLSHGIDAISISAAKAQAFNEKMIRFYLDRDGSEMMRFLVDCHPEADRIRAPSPASPSSSSGSGIDI
jgi:prophage maintenance system killer protein